MEFNIYGLKCDNPECDYKDDSIKFKQYEEYINYPCPKCGSPLLTQADYDTTMNIVRTVEMLKRLGLDEVSEDDEMYNVSVELDGTGIPKFDIKKIEEKIEE